jgi:2-amino-4-hydroxy-6-hydroxymethyldihydropteridine diphosphokinase
MGGIAKTRAVQHAGCARIEVNTEPSTRAFSCGDLAFVALGSNLGDRRQNILNALEQLRTFSDSSLLISSLRETEPIESPPGSPLFVNAAAAFRPRPDESPESLLLKLKSLEKQFGRQPKQVLNEARTLDLDLVAFCGLTRATPELTLPHPRAHLRIFVLEPLSEIAPDLVLPGQIRSVRELLNAIRPSRGNPPHSGSLP